LGQHDARRAGRAWAKTSRRGRVLIAASALVVVAALVILGVVYLTRGPSLASQYLAVANPANHRLDVEVDGYTDAQHDDLAEAKGDLTAEVATEHWFDTHLAAIKFPPHIAAISRALIRINGQRAGMTALQAQSTSLAQMRSFNRQHAEADAAVERKVKLIRQALNLPPPDTD
jgi:hypothetical protein